MCKGFDIPWVGGRVNIQSVGIQYTIAKWFDIPLVGWGVNITWVKGFYIPCVRGFIIPYITWIGGTIHYGYGIEISWVGALYAIYSMGRGLTYQR